MFKRLLMAALISLTFAVTSFAAISPTDEANILAGISASDATYYVLGGGLLIVMAGIWGFKRVKALLGS